LSSAAGTPRCAASARGRVDGQAALGDQRGRDAGSPLAGDADRIVDVAGADQPVPQQEIADPVRHLPTIAGERA